MIEYKKGNILKEPVEALVNVVNCAGAAGTNTITQQFKNTFPKNYAAYVAACKSRELQLGKMLVHKTDMPHNHKYIINFPTKRHWRGKGHMEDIDSGLNALAETIQEYNISSIAMPPLDSGPGCLSCRELRLRTEAVLSPLHSVRVVVVEPETAHPGEHWHKPGIFLQ